MQSGRIKEAMTQYRKALMLNPDLAEAHNNLGIGLLEKGFSNEAIFHFKTAIKINPRYFDAYFNFADALLQVGRTGEAINEYRKAFALAKSAGREDSALTISVNLLKVQKTFKSFQPFSPAR
jgi:tetratricopeptide (TPR) repeat protein